MTIGDDPLVMRNLAGARRPAQQTAEIEAVKRRDDQTDALLLVRFASEKLQAV